MVDLFSLTTFDGKGCCCSAIGTVILESTHLSDDSLRYSSVVARRDSSRWHGFLLCLLSSVVQ